MTYCTAFIVIANRKFKIEEIVFNFFLEFYRILLAI